MGNKLKEVTYLTVKELKKENIILPGKYSEIFEGYAKKLAVNLEDQNVIFKDLKQDCDAIDRVVKKTSENLNTLHKSTSDAKVAIENRDTGSLDSISKELEKMQRQIDFLQKELFSDSLTGAFNRKWFMDNFLCEDNFQNNGVLAFIDLDRFKTINDTHGHLVGDQVLKYLVNFFNKEIEYDNCKIVRYAGDEFILLFEDENLELLKNHLNRLQVKLSSQKLKSAKVDSLNFSFSYGLVQFKSSDSLDMILEKADSLMYENKKR